jgi:ArsR family transcriptional regulator, nickel/cobalt-responsive transcriptional repressor
MNPVSKVSSIDVSCTATMRLLSDPTRYAVVLLLLDRAQRVNELIDVLRVDPTLLSHHLRLLREAGLVNSRREGKGVFYSLSRRYLSAVGDRTLDFGCCRLTLN